MSVIDFKRALRAQVNRMADEHFFLQENLANVPAKDVPAYLDALDKHASDLSRLASRLYEPLVPDVPNVPNVSIVERAEGAGTRSMEPLEQERSDDSSAGTRSMERLEPSRSDADTRSDDPDPEAA